MKHNSSPALRKAIDFLEKALQSDEAKSEGRLPPLAQLAAMSGVSLVTMWKAATVFKKRGCIEMYPGQGIVVKAYRTDDSPLDEFESMLPSKSNRQTWTRVAVEIEKSILNGGLARGATLPSCKELAQQFGTSFPTLKKALHHLSRLDIITPHKRHYAVPTLTHRRSGAHIVLLKPIDLWGRSMFYETMFDTMFKHIEDQCARLALKLDIVDYREGAGELSFYPLGDTDTIEFPASENVLGYLYLHQKRAATQYRILAHLNASKKPTAILDTSQEVITQHNISPARHRIFSWASGYQAGAKAAHYFLELNHTRMAYISPFHALKWSQQRLEGMQDVLRRAGLPDGVEPLVFDKFDSTWKFYQHARQTSRMDSLSQAYHEWREQIPAATAGHLDLIMDWALRETIEHAEICHRTYPLLDRALKDQSITACVCANDLIAVMALQYLKHKGINVPQRLSLFGYDNSLQALKLRLTSFEFNMQPIATAMLQHVLQPPDPLRSKVKPLLEIDGYIVTRTSTAPRA
ncbi:MAG: GntR family transcriptional regulator [Chitinivibrionales bacterium]|nr:GntR family transcriptional regulator [Chitinivibrionales bacterium]